MSAAKRAKTVFILAMLLSVVSALAAYLTISSLNKSQQSVVHTHEVLNKIGKVESDIATAGRARMQYSFSQSQDAQQQFESAFRDIPAEEAELQKFVLDNPRQVANCTKLEHLTHDRMQLWQQSIEQRRKGISNAQSDMAATRQSVAFGDEISLVTHRMRDEELDLLHERSNSYRRFFRLTVSILAVAFAGALVLYLVYYRLLTEELNARAAAELAASQAANYARRSQEATRHLSVRLMQLQDEERRRFSRELHDSLGQYLSSLKMTLNMLRATDPAQQELLEDSIKILDQSISETRTLSHLLHPPLLDECGLAIAADWFVQGFSERSGVRVTTDIPRGAERLPREIELVLFRVLQEALTNIHRHAGSATAEVRLQSDGEKVRLSVADFGRGFDTGMLARFNADGSGSGVGLAGMRERLRELGGTLAVRSSAAGTTLEASIPLPSSETAQNLGAA